MNILPQSTLRIVRQLTDPLDVGTNYVRAVIRNSTSGDIVATINLTDATNQRFTGEYTTPPDISGMGYYLDVTTTVYSENTYTTKNNNYAIEAHTYFIHEEKIHIGGGGDVDYKKIRNIVQEILDGQEKPTMPTIKDLTPEIKAMEERIKDAVAGAVSSIRFPEQVRPDLDGVVSRISSTVENATNAVLMAVEQKEVTPPADMELLTAHSADVSNTLRSLTETVEGMRQTVDDREQVANMKATAEDFLKQLYGGGGAKPAPTQNEAPSRAKRLMGL